MVKSKNVLELPGAELPGLRVAATAATGVRQTGSRNEVWLCSGFCEDAGVMLYVKPALSQRAMFTEILAAQLGQCLKLPCPNPYLVTVNPAHVGRPRGRPVLAFGSEQVSERSLARPIRDLELLLQVLTRLKIAEAVCAFDEWIANTVRSPSDVLFDPEGRAYLIDHEGAMESITRPASQVTNWLGSRLTESLTLAERPALLRNLRAKVAAAHRTRLGNVPSAVQFAQDGVAIYRALLDFLAQRLEHLDQLLSQRVLPGQMYLSESAANDDNHESLGPANI
jgi:hypothetical protein